MSKYLWPVVVLLLCPGLAQAQCECGDGKPVTIDLALLVPGEVSKRSAEPGNYCFVLKNKIPNKACSISVLTEPVFEDPLVNPFEVSAASTSMGGPESADEVSCPTLAQISETLSKATSEAQIPGLIAGILAGHPAQCRDSSQGLINALTVSKMPACFTLGKREQMNIEVICQGNTEPRTVRLTTGGGGNWRTIYGFTFVPNEDERYFTRAGDEEGTFIIEQEEDREDFDYLPSVMFHRLSNKDAGKKWSDGFLAGLGSDSDNISLFAGWGWTYHENVTLTAGLAIHQQSRLDGQYDVGDMLKENLDEGQLLEETYGANVYFGVAFRFNSDPHAERLKRIREAEAAERKAAREAAARAQEEKKNAELAAAQLATCKANAAVARVQALAACESNETPDPADPPAAPADPADPPADPADPADPPADPDNGGPTTLTAAAAFSEALLDLCRQKAEAEHEAALATCQSAPLEERQANEKLEAIEDQKEKLKKKCLELAEKTELAAKASCPATPEDEKKKCETTAEKDRAAAELKCMSDAQS